ncbi:hypothetical protein BKA62DRAFT_707297 [Auriculariales sp. MPI-PUGE-AT-0066]|nr:hypothetical protein BKA62DRAFT_707297 [Auriculariales sp. MPI-PUGE-AT-0066]
MQFYVLTALALAASAFAACSGDYPNPYCCTGSGSSFSCTAGKCPTGSWTHCCKLGASPHLGDNLGQYCFTSPGGED